MSGIVENIMRIPVGTRAIDAYFIRPAGTGPYPSRLFLMEWPGASAFTACQANHSGADGIAGQENPLAFRLVVQ